MKPCDWCYPSKAFGDRKAEERTWQVPTRASDLPEFRAAVTQHAIVMAVREYKDKHGRTQEWLTLHDDRAQATLKWNRRLRGKQTLTLTDLTVIMRLLPNAMPTEGAIRRLLKVAEGGKRPAGWEEVDTSTKAAQQSLARRTAGR